MKICRGLSGLIKSLGLLLLACSATFADLSNPISTGKVIAIGDIHGDPKVLLRALRLGGAINSYSQWIGGNLTVVQTGDLIDRGPHDRSVLAITEKLAMEAKREGGNLLIINGNHEIMNVLGDMRYTSSSSFRDFENLAGGLSTPNLNTAHLPEGFHFHNAGVLERLTHFAPKGKTANFLASHPVYAVVGDSVFVHGGILPQYLDKLPTINTDVQSWMLGISSFPNWLRNQDSLIWSRDYSEGTPSSSVCSSLRTVLERLKVKRMVVGHSIQDTGINSACDGKVWRIDIGMSEAYHTEENNYPIEILSIQDGNVSILKGP